MLVGAVAALGWAFAIPAVAPAEPESTRLEWSAPPACPDRADIESRIETLLGAPLSTPREATVVARGEIVSDRASFVLRLEVSTNSGSRRREIAGGQCEELAQVAALLVAIAIDPGVAQLQEPGPEPEPEPRPAPPQPQPTAQPEASAPRELGGAVRFGAGLTVGPLPSAAALVHVAVALRWRWLRAEAGFGHRLARPAQSSAGTGASADIWATAGDVAMCGVPKLPHIEFPLCLGAEVGAVSGRSRQVERPARGGALWSAVRVGGGLIALPSERVGIVVDADLLVPVSRPGFVVDGVGALHRAGPIGMDAVIALEIRFP